MEPLDWEELRHGYNRMFGTQYSSVSEMLQTIYNQEKSCGRVGDIFGVCHTAVYHKMRRLNLNLNPKGGYRGSKCLRKILQIPVSELEHMKTKEIAKITGYQQETVSRLMVENGLKFKTHKKVDYARFRQTSEMEMSSQLEKSA
jgi:hypothetical protein